MQLERLTARVKGKLGRDAHTREMLLGSAVALMVKVLAAGAAFLMNIVVARKLGASESGLFFLGMTIVTLVAAVARMGLDNTLVRFIAAEQAAGNPGAILSIYRQGVRWAAGLAVLCMLALLALVPSLTTHLFDQPGFAPVLFAMTLAIPLLALSTLHAQALQGLKRIAQAMTTLNVCIPMLLLAALLALPIDSALHTAWAYIACCGLALLLGYAWWRKAAPYTAPVVHFERSTLIASCMPLWGVMLLAQLIQWSSQLLLGAWGSTTDVALFASALRTAMLTSFVLVAINSIAAPKFAAMHRQGDMQGLRRTALLSVRLMLLAAVPALGIMLLLPEWLMGLFGHEFRAAAPALMILALGQFVNIATGSVGFLLSMSGHERLLRLNMLIGAVLAVGLGLLLIPQHGLIGAAVATATAVAVQNLLGVFQVKRVLGFNTLAFWQKI